MRLKIVVILSAVGAYSLVYASLNSSSYTNIKQEKTILTAVRQVMSSEIEVVPDSLVLNISANGEKVGKAKIQSPTAPLTVNLDTLWDKEEYWKDIVPGHVIIRYNTYIDVHKASAAKLGITDKSITIVDKGIEPLNFIVVDIPGTLVDMKNFMKIIKTNPDIECIEPDRFMHICLTPNDTYYGGYQWDKRSINCPAAWDLGLGSMNISIAIVDEGVEYAHQDLQARFTSTKGYDFVSSDNDPKPEDTLEAHGTHCAGVAAATINNGLGIAGISNSHLYSVRVGDKSGNLTSSACANGIQWCADNKINVVSMSWGNQTLVAEIQNACKHADSCGCLLVSASGNDGKTPMNYPAALAEVIAVGATDSNNAVASFSDYGSQMSLVAPGVNITSTVPFGEYQTGWSGTSEACPQVSGTAALVWSANQTLTNHEVRAILDSTATDLGTAGWDQYYGYGKLNVFAAVQKASGMSGPRDTGTINVNNKSSASSNLIVSTITKKQSWVFSIAPINFGVAPGGTRQVTVVAGGKFPAGIYRDTLWISSNDPVHNPYPVPVILKVGIGVEENKEIVHDLFLQAQLNSARNQLIIHYIIPINSNVKLTLYDVSGRLVRNLMEGNQEPGNYNTNINTNNLGSGLYFVVLKVDNRQVSEKVVIVK